MRILIVYHSRTGNTKTVAQYLAKSLGADLEELTEIQSKVGIIGYLGAARNALLQKTTSINEIKHSITDYDLVIIGTPIWAWTIATPIRTFINQYKPNLKKVAFFATMGGSGAQRAFSHMEKIMNLHPQATISLIESEIKNDAFKAPLTNFIDAIKKIL